MVSEAVTVIGGARDAQAQTHPADNCGQAQAHTSEGQVVHNMHSEAVPEEEVPQQEGCTEAAAAHKDVSKSSQEVWHLR